MSVIYPVETPNGELTAEQIHLLLSDPKVIAQRVADLADQKFIADYLLANKYDAKGGTVSYSESSSLFAEGEPRQVAPGAEYPNNLLDEGKLHAVSTTKWGQASLITDEKIDQLGIAHVNAALLRLANSIIRHVDSVAMGVIVSKAQDSMASAGAWSTPGAILETLLNAQANRGAKGTGITLDTVLLSPNQYAKVQGMLLNEKALPRESANPVVNGNLPVDALGFNWVTSAYYKGTDPLLIDRKLFGGIADNNLKSPEFGSAGRGGVQVSVTRSAERDAYRIRARRVCVPVVTDPAAAVKITGHNLNG